MTRVHVVVEGPTEESFVNEVLAPALWAGQVYLDTKILGVPGHQGGRTNYARVRKDVLELLKKDRTAHCSTMLDFYGLGKGFPGTPVPPNLPNVNKVAHIEKAVKQDIIDAVPDLIPEVRFLPYIQLHEYEGLLFSDPAAFASGIRQPHLTQQFQQIRSAFSTPEDINDDSATAPSKRVIAAYPSYRKVLDGILGAQAVGIDKMRQECSHFRGWIERLEALSVK